MPRRRRRAGQKLQKFGETKPKEKVSRLVKKKIKIVHWDEDSDSASLDLGVFILYAYKDQVVSDKEGRDMFSYRYLTTKSKRSYTTLYSAKLRAEKHILERIGKIIEMLENRKRVAVDEELEDRSSMSMMTLLGV
ncbi:MAG: hypothetical protein KAS32_20045 [Candidatus Peribacteraceae bacterium]|nr:hypothetical protein [Candidatus Peribacteraceae bacterium]